MFGVDWPLCSDTELLEPVLNYDLFAVKPRNVHHGNHKTKLHTLIRLRSTVSGNRVSLCLGDLVRHFLEPAGVLCDLPVRLLFLLVQGSG